MRPSAPALAPALRPSQLARGVHSQCTLSLHRSWSLPVTCSRTVDARMSASSSCSYSHSPNKTFSSGQTKGSLLGRRCRTVLAGCRPVYVSPEQRRGISYAVGTQREEVESALKKLLRRKGDGPGQPAWRLTAAEDGLQRTFRFKTFGKTWVRYARCSFSLLSGSISLPEMLFCVNLLSGICSCLYFETSRRSRLTVA